MIYENDDYPPVTAGAVPAPLTRGAKAGQCVNDGAPIRLYRGEIYVKEYDKNHISLAKRLRKEMTPEERKLWHLFLKTYPTKFYRQKAIGRYIVDFYCAKARIAIEIDGTQHYSVQNMEEDDRRTNELTQLGIQVIRFSNRDINYEFTAVCEQIDMTIRTRLEGIKTHVMKEKTL